MQMAMKIVEMRIMSRAAPSVRNFPALRHYTLLIRRVSDLWKVRTEGAARDMIRISTIFLAICMVLVAASLGFVLYSVAGISGSECDRGAHRPHLPDPLQRRLDAACATAAMSATRSRICRAAPRTWPPGRRIRPPAGRGRRPRHLSQFRRRRPDAVDGREISELGGLVKHLAASVAHHEDMLARGPAAYAPASPQDDLCSRLRRPRPVPRRPNRHPSRPRRSRAATANCWARSRAPSRITASTSTCSRW